MARRADDSGTSFDELRTSLCDLPTTLDDAQISDGHDLHVHSRRAARVAVSTPPRDQKRLTSWLTIEHLFDTMSS
ncbi:hypothetical protein [Ilumatobacter coccineus]|uniref:Uncharacterized protein n=1 Tax=Ilumatobacter coccineus (strain NBRC 103263 / KCTC 29153 / YM16-304) TaxID=1313172 RepID=A0A6C7E9L2_ILUCY|nr:hypothetical protein [Ilumatobacter coccineus]BAN00736.1 hypothetical protein YM304_04220 [Ilumatobacter coccineus YM16-304]